MKREIKFRAWDKHRMDIFPIGEMFGYPDRRKAARGIDGFVLMQYTGLKDRNGKEIYEGDIYRRYSLISGTPLGGGDPWKENRKVVKYEVGKMGDYCGYFLCTPDPKYVEVIGNIYENPELVKE